MRSSTVASPYICRHGEHMHSQGHYRGFQQAGYWGHHFKPSCFFLRLWTKNIPSRSVQPSASRQTATRNATDPFGISTHPVGITDISGTLARLGWFNANITAFATSSGFSLSGFGSEKNGVSTMPGATTVHRPPHSRIS